VSIRFCFPPVGAFFLLEMNQLNELGGARIFGLLRFKGTQSGCATTPTAAASYSFGLNAFHSQLLTYCRAPGLKFGYTGEYVAITFGSLTTDTTLIGYRIDGQDWQFTNVTTNAIHLLVSRSTPGVNLTFPSPPQHLISGLLTGHMGSRLNRYMSLKEKN
jgi:hypothetical protein